MKADTTRKTGSADTVDKRYPMVVTPSAESHIIREPYENCNLHKALMNVGYEIYRKHYYIAGKYTGKKFYYYAPATDYPTCQGSESPSATIRRLQDLDQRLGTDFVGDYKRDYRGFAVGFR